MPASIDSKRDENEKRANISLYTVTYWNMKSAMPMHTKMTFAVILKHIENFAHALDMNVFTFIKELNGINTFKSNLFLMEQSTNVEYILVYKMQIRLTYIIYFILIPLI